MIFFKPVEVFLFYDLKKKPLQVIQICKKNWNRSIFSIFEVFKANTTVSDAQEWFYRNYFYYYDLKIVIFLKSVFCQIKPADSESVNNFALGRFFLIFLSIYKL